MPTVRKKFLKRKKDAPKEDAKLLTEKRYSWLISDMPKFLSEENPFDSPEDEEICYRANKSTIMERWLSDPKNHCHRPRCWWNFAGGPPAEIIGYEKWWSEGVDPGSGWQFAPVEEPDFMRIERAGNLQEFEKTVFEKEKISLMERLQGMRGIDMFFDSREAFEKWESEHSKKAEVKDGPKNI